MEYWIRKGFKLKTHTQSKTLQNKTKSHSTPLTVVRGRGVACYEGARDGILACYALGPIWFLTSTS